MTKTLRELILSGRFTEAKKMSQLIEFKKLSDLLFNIGYEDESLCAYSFICFLILENESADLHCEASALLKGAFSYLNGAYSAAFYHIKRALMLSPDDIDLEETLLSFYFLPLIEPLLSKEEVEKIADRILKQKPNSLAAKDVFNESRD